ncbi:MAG: tRNA 2-thiouridine(34) synthase MnmA [Nitrospirae bacterium]|nr:tRNA 2-thiouridine(34) synthase MnmA [Nitrospirota bacterium]
MSWIASPKTNKTVVVGMSGGVDSCATALILKEQGYRVIGVTLKVWKDEENPDRRWQERSCCKVGVARYVAQRLGIEHHVIDVQPEFRRAVIDDFVAGYLGGETPNPCVRCNERIKFGRLFEIAMEFGADFLATGHYVRLERNERTGRPVLKRAADGQKDQSYFLYRLQPGILPRLIFPLGNLKKADVRRRVESLDLPADEMQESQEICFVTQQDYRQFLSIQAPEASRPGRFVSSEGEDLGRHQGVAFYTIGQRRGLGLSAAERLYVIDIRPEDNTVVVGAESELLCEELRVNELNLFTEQPLERPMDANVKIRYRNEAAPARIEPLDEKTVRVNLQSPQRAVTPGQSAVFYRGDELLGGGIICDTVRLEGRDAPRPAENPSQNGHPRLDKKTALC